MFQFLPTLILGLLLFVLNSNQVVVAQEIHVFSQLVDDQTINLSITVTDNWHDDQPIPFAKIRLLIDDEPLVFGTADWNGILNLQIPFDQLNPNEYLTILFYQAGYTAVQEDVQVQDLIKGKELTFQAKEEKIYECVLIYEPLPKFDRIGETNFSREDIQRMPRN